MESTDRNYNAQENQSQYGSSYNPYASETYTTNYTTYYTTGGGNSSPVVNMSSSSSGKGEFFKFFLSLIFIGALISPCILSPIINAVAFNGILDAEDYEEDVTVYQPTINNNEDDYNDWYDGWYDNWYDDKDKNEEKLPYSDVFKAFAEEVFGKPYDEITTEEYATVTYIHSDSYENYIEYAINDGEIKTFTYSNDIYEYIDKDIKCFTGLKVLNVGTSSFYYEDSLKGLTQLKEVYSGNSAKELANMIEYPDNIEKLGLYDDFNSKELAGIEEFVNVTSLYISSYSLTSLDGLENLTKLKELEIYDGNKISNFTALSKLTNLEKLSISSNKLKDLAVLENMTKLKELIVISTEMNDVSTLAKFKDTLIKLELGNMYQVDDYRVIDELVNLEELSMKCGYETVMPQFTNMKNLKRIYVHGAEDVSTIANATNLEEIELLWCDFNDVFPFTNMKSVKSLTIKSPYSFPDDMSGIVTMTSIENLDVESFYFYGNAEAMFNLPNLKRFSAKNASFGIDTGKMIKNTSLEVVDLSNASISKYVFVDLDYYDYYKREDVDGAYITSIISCFPNVKELYIKGLGIEDLSFVKNLTLLEKLDISDNDITKLKPLAELANLKCVWCEGNSIIDADSLSEKVELIFEEKY